MADSAYYIKILEQQVGQRLDNFLLKELKGVPKSHVYRIVRKGEVRINKKRCKVQQRLELGDQVRIPPIRVSQRTTITPTQSAQDNLLESVLFEDEHLMILNKASGWAVHAGSGNDFGVIETLKTAKQNVPFIELVHRLDKDTSGCLMIAKSRKALLDLQQLLRTHDDRLSKTYLALLKGQWKAGNQKIDLGLKLRVDQANNKASQVDHEGKPAQTQFLPSRIFNDTSLMKVRISTGRMHQIRVHSAHLDHPVVGDRKYGDFEFNRHMRKTYGLNRIFLHASKLNFKHPISGQKMQFFAPIPESLKKVLTELENEV